MTHQNEKNARGKFLTLDHVAGSQELTFAHFLLKVLSMNSRLLSLLPVAICCAAALIAFPILIASGADSPAEKVKVLLVDGQNNHAWKETTPVLVQILQDSGRFEVEVTTTPPSTPRAPRRPRDQSEEARVKHAAAMKAWQMEVEKVKELNAPLWKAWRPKFDDFDVVVSNYNGELWTEEVRNAFENYVRNGGGFVSVHAADNAFPQWKAYNEMIAVGGWGGRSELSGPYLRFRDGEWIKDKSRGRGGSHGAQHEFLIETRAPNHPIVKGLPQKWLHAQDELYDRLRGPAKNVTVLASAFSDESTRGSGEDEPILMAIDFGKGRCFHTTLGHSANAMSGLGFQETLKRGVEWVATGKVTFPPVGEDALTAEKVALAKSEN